MKPAPPDPVYTFRPSVPEQHLPQEGRLEITSLCALPEDCIAVANCVGYIGIWSLDDFREKTSWRVTSTLESVLRTAWLPIDGTLASEWNPTQSNTTRGRLWTQGRDNLLKIWRFDSVSGRALPDLEMEIVVESLTFCMFEWTTYNGWILVAHSVCDKAEQWALKALKYETRTGEWTQRTVLSSVMPKTKNGMMMRLGLSLCEGKGCESGLFVLAAYEGGDLITFLIPASTLERLNDPDDFTIRTRCLEDTVSEIASIKAHPEPILSLSVHDLRPSNDEMYTLIMGTCSVDSEIQLLALKKINDFPQVISAEKSSAGHNTLLFRPDGKLLAVGGFDGHVRIYSTRSKGNKRRLKLLCVLKAHSERAGDVCFVMRGDEGSSPLKKNMFVVGGRDGKVSIWEIY